MPTSRLNAAIVTAAIEGFEQQKLHIDSQIAELRAMLSGSPNEPAEATSEPTRRKRRKMSAAARKRMAAAQRKRWAQSKVKSAVRQEAPKAKRRLSAAGRKAIIAATKKRWALKRAEAAKAQSRAKKSATKTA